MKRLWRSTALKKTANEVEIAEMLQICSMADHVAKTYIVSMVPEDIIAVEVGLSPIIMQQWGAYIDAVLNVCERVGLTCKPKKEQMRLENILDIFANPSHEKGRRVSKQNAAFAHLGAF